MKSFTDIDDWSNWLISAGAAGEPFCFIWKNRKMLAKRDRRGMWSWKGLR